MRPGIRRSGADSGDNGLSDWVLHDQVLVLRPANGSTGWFVFDSLEHLRLLLQCIIAAARNAAAAAGHFRALDVG